MREIEERNARESAPRLLGAMFVVVALLSLASGQLLSPLGYSLVGSNGDVVSSSCGSEPGHPGVPGAAAAGHSSWTRTQARELLLVGGRVVGLRTSPGRHQT